MTSLSDLQQNLLRNFGWQALSVFFRAAISIVTLGVLARIAGPDTMGLYGLAWVGPAVTFPLLQVGVGQALFLIKKLSPGHVSAAFGITLGIAVLAAMLVVASAPIVANILNLPELTSAYWLVSAFIPLMAFGVVDIAITQRDLDFRKVAGAQTASVLSSSALALFIAVCFDPLMGLFAFQGTPGLFQYLYFRLTGKKCFGLAATRADYAEVWAHGRHLAANSVSASVMVNIPQLILGTMLTVDQLGMYTLSRRIIELINNQVSAIAGQVLFPTLALHRGGAADKSATYFMTSRLSATVVMLPMLVFAVCPESVLYMFGGNKWTAAADVLLFLTIMQIGLTLAQNLFAVMQAVGGESWVWKWNIGFTFWQLTLLLTLGGRSAEKAAAIMALSTLGMPLAGYFLSRLLHYRMRDWILNMASAIVPALIIGPAVFWLGITFGQNLPALLRIVIFGGFADLLYLLVVARLDPLIWGVISARFAYRQPGR
jgi:O-antigen/teichoic acid export membrane protein